MRSLVVGLASYVLDSSVFGTLLPVAPSLLVWVVALTLLGAGVLAMKIACTMDGLFRD